MTGEAALQRDYYAKTAVDYDRVHVNQQDEHFTALSAFGGLIASTPPASILDVGAGTGRGVEWMAAHWPSANVVGVEPVAELRAQGHARGVPTDRLIEGDALALDFADDAFDFVVETGMLHHVREPRKAVAEMTRVARYGVMLSDSNRYGQGGLGSRIVKDAMRRLNLWTPFVYLQTRGKMHKWSEGDGIYYSYSVFDEIPLLQRKFSKLHVLNTNNSAHVNPRFGSSHAMLLAVDPR